MNTKLFKFFFFSFIVLISFSCKKDDDTQPSKEAELNTTIDTEFKQLQMQGLACLAVKNDSVVFTATRGYANVEQKKEFTNQTRMIIASVSKTITLTAIMQLEEKGLVKLDTDVSQYLPFQVRNPHYPDSIITLRMLLTHTSSISDSGYSPVDYYSFGYQDYTEPLSVFEQNYLTQQGSHYTANSYSNNKPGTAFEYSNVAIGLVGSMVEHITNKSFNTYCKENIFEPLEMNKTTWFFSETPQEEVAIPYAFNPLIDPTNPFFSYPTYPDGHLITTIQDLSKFMRAYMKQGVYKQSRILQATTVNTILSSQFLITENVKLGLVFENYPIGNYNVWGHNGGDPGVSTEMYFDKEQQVGYIMFNNRSDTYSPKLPEALLDYAKKF